jgi:hypothetical protein
MKTMRYPALVLGIVALCASSAAGQQASTAQAAPPTASPAAENRAKAWSFAASAYTYFLPDDTDYVQPTFTADRGRLHLEARYNYEDLETGSAFLGVTFGGGERVTWELTPMIGGVFGSTDGIAPGYKGSLGWRKLELYSEGEYVIDLGDSSASFFYNWSELTFAPAEWVRFGIVGQRTRVYKSDRDIQRGLLVAFTYKRLDVAGYVFNPDDSKPIVVISVRVDF